MSPRCTNYTCYYIRLSGEAASASREAERKWIGEEGCLWIRLLILAKLLCIRSKCPRGLQEGKQKRPGLEAAKNGL